MASKAKKQIPEIEVCIDTQIVNTPGIGASVMQACEKIGMRCIARTQLLPSTVTWQLVDTCQSCLNETAGPHVEELDEVLAIVPVTDFMSMVNAQQQLKVDGIQEESITTLSQYIINLQQLHPGKRVSLAAVGLDKYFSDQKLDAKRRHREAVTGQKQKIYSANGKCGTSITRFQLEEVLVEAQLVTGCCCRLVENAHEVAELVRTFTKAVAEKPNKKNRLDSVFSFLEEGEKNVKADKDGVGLHKVWRLQLQQLHNLGPDVAAAIATKFQSPLALRQAYDQFPDQEHAWKVTENILVRRGAGVLETERRVGPQLSKRIHTLMMSSDPDQVIQ